jgi:formylmethanofuran dehydrogenase subunit C
VKTITLTLKKKSPIALEFDELIPDKVFDWEKVDFEKYQVPVGNRRFH